MNKENDEGKKFFIGLDIGTESVGFAVTDENYRVPQKNRKPLMGVRLFEEAATAAERRVFRANKVRMGRVKQRIALLQELLDEAVQNADSLFFIRLQSSSYWLDDKEKQNGALDLNSLFADGGYKDKDYFKQFKTIYHLRNYLADEKNWNHKIPDIRLVYLACHHILKARGHFLYEADSFQAADEGKHLFEGLKKYLLDEEEQNSTAEVPRAFLFNTDNFIEIEKIAKDEKIRYGDKKEKLLEILSPDNPSKVEKKRSEAFVKAILGRKVKLSDLFLLDFDEAGEGEISAIEFDKDFEPQEGPLRTALEEKFALIEILKNIYDWFVLEKLLKGKSSISDAMLDRFNSHKIQLNALKRLVKEKAPGKYFKVFRDTKEQANYAAYIGSNLSNGKAILKKCKQDEFYEFLKKELGTILTDNVKQDIENHSYLLKLRSKDNATIPYQLHKAELEKILTLAEKHKLISGAKDNDGLTIKDKIISIISFRVPYYVGRLNPYYKKKEEENGKKDVAHHVWIEKKRNEKIYPWNYREVIDLKKSGENFIQKMLSRCTYLKCERVLPKNSLLYSEFTVLNELNNLKIKGDPISVAYKQKIFNGLFKSQKSVSIKALLAFLGNIVEKEDIGGIDVKAGKFHASMSSYIEAYKIFGNEIETADKRNIVERVLLWHALHTDKRIVEESIKEEYPQLSGDTVNKLKGLNYSGFGNLSEKFLTAYFVGKDDNRYSIMDLLRDTDQNLMEIIHNPIYGIEEWLQAENYKDGEEIGYDIIQESYASPSVKRAAWQAMKVVGELIELNGGRKPDKIFIEVTRSGKQQKGDKGRKLSRKMQLEEKFKAVKDVSRAIKDEIKSMQSELDQIEDDNMLRSEKIYLYFLQCGKCAYSGDEIKLSDILYDNKNYKYDVDHIIPQALKKDDSLTNKVLVRKDLNLKKDRNYPLNQTPEIWKNKDKLIPMWKAWQKCGLINFETLDRLMRTKPITEKELEGFIARQLVFTGQVSTAVADLFKKKYEGTEIVYSKAENVSDFRKKFDLLKCRDANDHHHAHDAYLNIVVGNTFSARFTRKYYLAKYDNDAQKKWSVKNMFEYDVEGVFKAGNWEKVISADGKKEKVQTEKGETQKTIERHLSLKYLPVSKKTSENKGAFYKQTVFSPEISQKQVLSGAKSLDDAKRYILRKGNLENPLRDDRKYGGYSSMRPAYFMILEYDVVSGSGRNRKVSCERAFDSVNLLDKKEWELLTEEEKCLRLFDKHKTLNKKGEVVAGGNLKIIMPKILIYSLFEIDAIQCRLAGWNGANVQFHNATQIFYNKESSDYIRIIAKYNDLIKNKKMKAEEWTDANEIIVSGNRPGLKEYKLTKANNQKLWDEILKKINSLYGEKMVHLKGKNLGLPDLYDKLAKNIEKFAALDCVKQIGVLTALIVGLGCNASAFDLSEFGDGKKVSTIQPSVKIKYPLTLINQSVTGIKENRITVCDGLDENKNPIYPRSEG